MKLTTALLQKLATFYMWNIKQKNDEMDQSTLHSCYCDDMTINKQLFHKVCKSVLIRNIRFLTLPFITTTLHDVLDKNRYHHHIS